MVPLPFNVDPHWYDRYWLADRRQPNQRPLARSLRHLAVVLAVLAGGGAVLGYFDAVQQPAGMQDWEEE
jgi:hypothetical protein